MQGLETSKEFEGICEDSAWFSIFNFTKAKPTNKMKIGDGQSTETNKQNKRENLNKDAVTDENSSADCSQNPDKTLNIEPKNSEEVLKKKKDFNLNENESFSEERFRDNCSSIFGSISSAIGIGEDKSLSQMADEYRQQHPELWSAKEAERQKRLKGSSSKTEKMDSFLDSYYERQSQIQQEKKEKERRFKTEVITRNFKRGFYELVNLFRKCIKLFVKQY